METYFVLAEDGQRYGPATLGDLKKWHADHRLTAGTILIRESDGERLTAKAVLGLEEEIAPPVQSSATSAPPSEAFLPNTGSAPRKTSTVAIVLIAILGVFGVCGAIGAAVLFPVFAQAEKAAKKTLALSNLKQAALAGIMYASDYDDRFPPALGNSDLQIALMPYAKNQEIFVSTNPAGGEIVGNKNLAKVKVVDLTDPAATIFIYDSLPWASSGMLTSYADGHVKAGVSETVFKTQFAVRLVKPAAKP